MNFFKKIFTIPGAKLPDLKPKMPALDIRFGMPKVMGWSPSITFKWPRVKIPGGSIRVGIAASVVGLVIAGGAYLLATEGIEASPEYPQAAVYDVGTAYELERKSLRVGKKSEQAAQTLNLLVGGARMDVLYFDNISVGKATGLEQALKISGTAENTLQCDTVLIDGLEAPSLWIGNANIHELIIKDNFADGLSIGATLSSVSDISVGSTRGTISITDASDSTYDRIIIDSSSADSICNTLTLKNIKAYGTYADGNAATTNAIHLENMDIGTLTIQNSIIGSGTGIDSPDFTIATTTNVTTTTLTNNIERPITIK